MTNTPDYTGLRQLKIFNNSVKDYKMVLLKNSGEKIMNLGNSKISTITVSNGQPYELQFTVPRYFTDDITLRTILNSEYDYVLEKQIIQLNGVDKFVIEDIVENDGTGSMGGDDYTVKTVTAYSLDYSLNKKQINLPNTERELWTTKGQNQNVVGGNSLNEIGYLNLVDEGCLWKANYVDPNILVDTESDGSSYPRVRSIGATNTYIYPFMNSTLASSFDGIFFFNSHNLTYDVFNLKTYGTKRPYILSLDNIITDFQRESNIENTITRLYCTGDNNITFTEINPLGTSYIEDLTPFRNSTYMSSTLLSSLNRYDKLCDSLHSQFLTEIAKLPPLQNSLSKLQEEQTSITSQITTQETIRSTILKTISSASGVTAKAEEQANLKTTQTQINTLNSQLATNKSNISSIQGQIKELQATISGITSQYDKSTSKDSQGLIFNASLIQEYDSFIIEGSYSNSSCTTGQQLMTQSKKYLAQQNEPVYTFTLNVNDFLQGLPFNEEEKMNITLNLGDEVRVRNKIMSIDTYVRFIGYVVTPLSDELTMTFSTLSIDQNATSVFSNTMSNINSAVQEVTNNKYFWNINTNNANWIANFKEENLNLIDKAIVSHNSENIVNINENGIYLTNANETQNQLALTNNILAMTQDGWQTASIGITPQGIYGDTIVAGTVDSTAFNVATLKTFDKIDTFSLQITENSQGITALNKESVGTTTFYNKLNSNPKMFSEIVGETTAISDVYTEIKETTNSITESYINITDKLQDSITENANGIKSAVTVDNIGTTIEQNASSVEIAWNKNSSSVEFTNGEILCHGSNGGTVTISGNGGITYTNGNGGGTSGLTTGSFAFQIQIQNGYTKTISLPSVFKGLELNSNYQLVVWAGNIDSDYNEVFDKDALRNVFVNIVSSDSSNATVTIMPCIQKIGLETLTMWGWDSKTTTSGNRECEGMVNCIGYATLLTNT